MKGKWIHVSSVHIAPASDADVDRGLVGFVQFVLDDAVRIEAAVRRTASGVLRLSFPERCDSRGRRHARVRPLDQRVRESIERQVFEALGLEEVAR